MREASVKAGDAALLKACAPEIAVMAADARKAGSDIRDGDVPALITDRAINWWWDDEATARIRREYKETSRCKGERLCVRPVCDHHGRRLEGVREPAQLRGGWKPFPAALRARQLSLV